MSPGLFEELQSGMGCCRSLVSSDPDLLYRDYYDEEGPAFLFFMRKEWRRMLRHWTSLHPFFFSFSSLSRLMSA